MISINGLEIIQKVNAPTALTVRASRKTYIAMLSLSISPVLNTQDVISDYHSGYFDGSIGLEAASDNEEYRKGYYQGLAKFLDW